MNVCIIIPNYNHPNIERLLVRLAPYNLPYIIIDDGSNTLVKEELKNAQRDFPTIQLITLATNRGKGAAVVAGLEYAATQNYTHAIQIDADGQHDTTDIPKFLAAIASQPTALIGAQPVYDASTPRSRLYGRKITNFWVALETLSLSVKDAMCGYRAYPITKTLQVIHSCSIGKSMDFDIEILVRLHWAKTPIIFFPSLVTYPKNGVSHFKTWADNYKISCLHARLFFMMLLKLPQLLSNKVKSDVHWSRMKEKGSLLGMIFILYSYKILGHKITSSLLYPIVSYFYCFSPRARKASKEYLAKFPSKPSSYKHFLAFADSLIDKLAVWNNDITLNQIEFQGADILRKLAAKKEGALIITAHLGNMEVARALGELEPEIKINAITFNKNAIKFASLLNSVNKKYLSNLICIENFDLVETINLQNKIDNGEIIIIAGDRTSTTKPQNSLCTPFLEGPAYFPKGPFILASIFRCPVFFMLCLKGQHQTFRIVLEPISSIIKSDKITRDQQVYSYGLQYSQLLEKYCRMYPLQWFNFFNFWQLNDEQK